MLSDRGGVGFRIEASNMRIDKNELSEDQEWGFGFFRDLIGICIYIYMYIYIYVYMYIYTHIYIARRGNKNGANKKYDKLQLFFRHGTNI